MVRFFLFFLGLLSFLVALTLGGCGPSASGTFTVGDQTTALTYSYATLQSDKNDPKQNIVVVLFADRPVEAADRQPSRLMALTKSKKLHALRLTWRRDTLDDLRVVLYHPEIIASGLAFCHQYVLDIKALKGRHIEAEVYSKKRGRNWAFTVKFKADLVKGGVAELEPLAPVDAYGKGSGEGSSSQWISELDSLGYEFTDDDFFHAMIKGNVRAIRLFLNAGMSPNVKGSLGDSALMEAISLCKFPPIRGHREHNTIVLVLIEAKADVNFRNKNGYTPLFLAADNCEPEVIQALINAGAEVNARSPSGGTALVNAEISGKTENAKILRKAGGTR